MKRRLFSLDSIIERGDRVYDILAIITFAAGINILTSITIEANLILCSTKFWLTVVSGILLILSGVKFSWLSYWIKKYVEEKTGHFLLEATQKIIRDGKEKKFVTHSVMAWSFLLSAIPIFLIGRIYG